jgi:hypothetical protein
MLFLIDIYYTQIKFLYHFLNLFFGALQFPCHDWIIGEQNSRVIEPVSTGNLSDF